MARIISSTPPHFLPVLISRSNRFLLLENYCYSIEAVYVVNITTGFLQWLVSIQSLWHTPLVSLLHVYAFSFPLIVKSTLHIVTRNLTVTNTKMEKHKQPKQQQHHKYTQNDTE